MDVYGSVTEVKVLPMQWRDSLVLRIGQLPKDMTKTKIYCQYFQLCRRFLSAQRFTISGIIKEIEVIMISKCPGGNKGIRGVLILSVYGGLCV